LIIFSYNIAPARSARPPAMAINNIANMLANSY